MSLRDARPIASMIALAGAIGLAGALAFVPAPAIAGSAAVTAPADPATAATSPAPDPRWQEAIAQVVASIVRQDDDAAARLETLRDLGRDARPALLAQIALFLERSDSTERSMGGALLVHELAFTPQEKLDAILPHLGAAGPGLRQVFTGLLSTIDRPEGGEPDFSLYEQTLRARRASPPQALIIYMYEASPGAALESMERVFGSGAAAGASRPPTLPAAVTALRGILSRPAGAAEPDSTRAREDLLKARAALDDLTRDPAWWRRAYAAAILKEHRELSTPELAARVSGDTDAVVRQAGRGE